MKKAIVVAIVLGVFLVGLTACSPKFQDLTAVENAGDSDITAIVSDPDSVTIYRNIDEFPNIGVMCVNGDAFVYRSANYNDVILVHIPSGNHNLCS